MAIATKTWVVGNTLPAADLNIYLRDVVTEINPASQGQGDLLVVDAAATGYDFFDVSANAGKYVKVNSGGTGLEGVSLAIFGTGADGALSISSGTTTLAADKNYTTVSVTGTAILETAGYIVRCQGTFTNSATVRNNGQNGGAAVGTTPGAAGAAGGGGGIGGAGVYAGNGGPAAQMALGSGAGTGSGGYTGGAKAYSGPGAVGGAGGGGGGGSPTAGGGGGGGGGVMRLCAPLFTGTGVFEAKGGDGGAGTAGGGGNGGYIEFLTLAALGGSLTTSVAAGAGTGNAGSDGVVRTINMASGSS